MKNQREIKGPRKVNTRDDRKKNRKIRLQTVRRRRWQCRTKEIDRAHRSHSTGEAKQNKNNQEESRIINQGNKIAWLYPCTPTRPGCIQRRVCTGDAIPYTYSINSIINIIINIIANPAVNTPRPSRGTRIESCDFIVSIGDLWFVLFVSFCLASRVEWERWALSISFVWHVACDFWLSGAFFFWGVLFYSSPIIACLLTFLGPFISFRYVYPFWVVNLWPRKAFASVGPVRMLESTE